jgi:hypothetical protein
MVKVVSGTIAAILIAVAGYFGFEFYVQKQVETEVGKVFADLRATGAKATHGQVSFNLLSRTVTVADISGESSAQPPMTVKIGRFVASGVSQPEAGRFAADRIEASDIDVSGTMTMAGQNLALAYKAPRAEVVGYAGPAAPTRKLENPTPVEIYRFALDQFAQMSATSITVPTVTAKMTAPANAPGGGDYTYSGIAMSDIRNGKIATTSVESMKFTVPMRVAGKNETMTGDIAKMTALDFDAAATAVMLDPAKANDTGTYRIYRQMSTGAYTVNLATGVKMRIAGINADDIGVRPSKLQYATLMAIVDAAPPPGSTPTPEQVRDMIEKMAVIYEGFHIGGAEVRGLSVDTPQGPFKLAALRLTKLDGGKLGEFALEGMEGNAPQGPVKVARFALKSFDIANLMRMASQFSGMRGGPSPDQIAGLLLLLEGTEVKGLVAPYRTTGKPVSIESLNLNWGQFVGPVPTRLRGGFRMTGPVDLADPEPMRMLASSGMDSATIGFDLGAAWAEGAKTFGIDPVTLEVGNIGTAALRISLANVPREVFSVNPLQAAIMAAQIEAGTLELAVRDTGGVDLAVAQYAKTQGMNREDARAAIIQKIRESGQQFSGVNPDAMAIAGAIARFIEMPRGTLNIKLTPKGRVPVMQLADAMKTSPLLALMRFQVDAGNGR